VADGNLILTLPRELAETLIETGEAAPYLRESRIDPTLVSAVVVAAATAATTVIVTEFTKAIGERIAGAIRDWMRRRDDEPHLELVIQANKATTKVTIEATGSTDAIVRILEAAAHGDIGLARQIDDQRG